MIASSRKVWNSEPWRGSVTKSASICWVGQYSIETALDANRSVTKKYRIMLMCRVRFPIDAQPFACFQEDGTLIVLVDKRI